jgi:hypothetical protein
MKALSAKGDEDLAIVATDRGLIMNIGVVDQDNAFMLADSRVIVVVLVIIVKVTPLLVITRESYR